LTQCLTRDRGRGRPGHPDFQALQHYPTQGPAICSTMFSICSTSGDTILTGLPLRRRKELLKKILPLFRTCGSAITWKKRASCSSASSRQGAGRDRREARPKRLRSGQKEPAVAEGEDADHPGGRDRRIHGTGREQELFREPGPRLFKGDPLISIGSVGTGSRRRSQGHPRTAGASDPKRVPL